MPEVEQNAFAMEKTPAYFSYPPHDTPFQIKKNLPNVKLLLIVCDPTKRARSDYAQMQAMNVSIPFKTFERFFIAYTPILEKVEEFKNWTDEKIHQKSKYLLTLHRRFPLVVSFTTGFYALHLHRWLPYFNRSNLMIIDGEKMFTDPGSVIEKVQGFLKIPRLLLRNDYVKDPKTGFFCVKNFGKNNTLQCLPSSKQRTRNKENLLQPDVKKKLDSLYASHNEALFKMIGERFDW